MEPIEILKLFLKVFDEFKDVRKPRLEVGSYDDIEVMTLEEYNERYPDIALNTYNNRIIIVNEWGEEFVQANILNSHEVVLKFIIDRLVDGSYKKGQEKLRKTIKELIGINV